MIIDIGMVLLGWLSHHLSLLARIHAKSDTFILPHQYIAQRPYKFVLSVTATVGAAAITLTQFETMETARWIELSGLFAIGLSCDGLVDQFGKFVHDHHKK